MSVTGNFLSPTKQHPGFKVPSDIPALTTSSTGIVTTRLRFDSGKKNCSYRRLQWAFATLSVPEYLVQSM